MDQQKILNKVGATEEDFFLKLNGVRPRYNVALLLAKRQIFYDSIAHARAGPQRISARP